MIKQIKKFGVSLRHYIWLIGIVLIVSVNNHVYSQNPIRFVRAYGPPPTNVGGIPVGINMIYLDEVQYITADSGYIAAGMATYVSGTSGFPPVPQIVPPQFFVIRTDKWGRPLWMKGLENAGGPDHAHSIVQTSDGNFVVVGQTTLGGTDSGQVAVVKLASNGASILWAIRMGTNVPEDKADALSVIEHSSGKIIVAGYDSSTNNLRDGLIFALDQNGNLLWQSSIGNTNTAEGFEDVIEAHNGNVIALGYREGQIYLVEVDPNNGNVITTKTYGVAAPLARGVAIAPNPSGGYVITGMLVVGANPTMLVISIDDSYNVQWSKIYSSASQSQGFDVKVHNNVIYLVGNAPPVNNFAQMILSLVALNSTTGNILWDIGFTDQFTSAFVGAGIDITPTGPVFVGWHTAFGSSGANVSYQGMMVKTDFSGNVIAMDTCLQVDVALTDSPIVLTTGSGGIRTQRLTRYTLSININNLTDHDSICVTDVYCNLLIDSVKTTNVLCVGDTSGFAYYWISGGTQTYTHYLSNGQVFTGDTVGSLPAGTYIDSIVDAAGCFIIDTFEILAPDTVTIAIDSVQHPSGCATNDGWVKISVTGGTSPYTITWSNGATGDSITGLGQGVYVVEVSDSNGCYATDTVVLNPQGGLSVNVTHANPLCNGDSSGWIKVTVSGGTTPYTHTWSNGMTGDSIYNLPAGTYIDSIYDANGCWIMDTITLVNPPAIVVNAIDSSSPSSCGASDGWIKVSVNGGTPPYTITWSNGATGDSIGGLSSGVYIFTIADSNSCSHTDTVTLSEPGAPQVVSTVVKPPTCNGDASGWIYVQVSGGTQPYTHNWSNGTSTSSDTLYGVGAGTYTDTIVDASGCQTVITVNVSDPPPLELITNSGNPTSCSSPDGWATVNVSGGKGPYIITWSTGAVGDSLYGVGPGTYTVYVRDSLGCIDSALVVLSSPDAPVITLSEELVSCDPPSYKVIINVDGGTEPYVVYWGNYDTTTALTNTLPPGNFIIVVKDLQGCVAYDTLNLEFMDTVWAITKPQIDTITPGDTVQLHAETNGGTWWWTPGEYLNDSLDLNPFAQPITTTEFYFYSYNAQGCFDIDTVLIVVEGEPIVHFPDYFSPNGDGQNDIFRPLFWGDVEILWRVYNRWSEIVFEGTEDEAWDGTYKGKPQQMDAYVLVAFITPRQGSQKGKTTKIVKNILLIR